jgi:hypothetical protein
VACGESEIATKRFIVPHEFSIAVPADVEVAVTPRAPASYRPRSPIVSRLSFSPQESVFVTIAAWTEWTSVDEVVAARYAGIDPDSSEFEVEDTRSRGDIEVTTVSGLPFTANGEHAAHRAMAVITAEEREQAWVIVCSGGVEGSADEVEEACDEVIDSFELNPARP